MSLIISAKALQSRLGKSDLLIVDTRSFTEYCKGHIPGAVNVDLMQFHWIDTTAQGIRAFKKQSLQLLSSIGVSKRKQVVFYDNISGASAARGVWLLLYFSHPQVAMLDGGFRSWKSCSYKIEKQTNAFRPTRFEAGTNNSILARAQDIVKLLRSNTGVIIDARTAEEYLGLVARAAHRGHIPGAINIDWMQNISAPRFKEAAALKKIYSSIPRESNVITYCQGGYRAANTFVVLRHLGFKKVKMYLGSWGEWGNRTTLPFTQERRSI